MWVKLLFVVLFPLITYVAFTIVLSLGDQARRTTAERANLNTK